MSPPSLHRSLAQQEPIEGDLLLLGQRDQEVDVRDGSALVAVDVLLEDPEVEGELSLGSLSAHSGQSLGQSAFR